MVQCNFCGPSSLDYPTIEQMRTHIKEVHITQRRIDVSASPAMIKDIEKAKATEPHPIANSKGQVVEQNRPEVPPPPPKKPIVLEYRYTGECPQCGIPVETHELKVGGGLYMVAWCNNGHKQLKDLKVIPINQMESTMLNDDAESVALDEEKGVWPINKFRRKNETKKRT